MEYSEEAVKAALKLSKSPPEVDHSVIRRVLNQRLLELNGFNPKDLTLEEVCLELCKRIQKLQDQIDQINQKTYTGNQMVTALIAQGWFTPKQKKLLKALSNCRPVHEDTLIKKVDAKNGNSTNLRSLIRETRKRLDQFVEKGIIRIDPLRGKPYTGYIMIIDSPLVKRPSK